MCRQGLDARRRLARDESGAPRGRKLGAPPGPGATIGSVGKIDKINGRLVASISGSSGQFYNPAERIAAAITDSLDPVKAPGKVKTLADMTPEQRARMHELYGRKKA